MQWILYMVATGQMNIPTAIGTILAALPGYIASL